MGRVVVIVGTLDTKGEEIEYLRDRITRYGQSVVVIDVGTLDPPMIEPDISRIQVAEAARSSMAELEERKDRRLSVETMIRGASRIVEDLYREGKVAGIISVGGGTGTHIGMGVMRSLPLGIPKLMVSTVASRDMSALIGTKDIAVLHSVADLLGLNAVTRKILANAAAAISHMASEPTQVRSDRPIVGLTSFGFITQGAMQAKAALEKLGYEVVPFHANGTGGMALEDLVEQGIIQGVLDFALHEFADALYDGYCKGIGPTRLETAGKLGLPQVIVPGGLDCIVLEFDSVHHIPPAAQGRKVFWYDFRSGVRTSRDDMKRLAEIISEKLSRAKGPVKILVPLRGFSEADQPGGALFEPDTDLFFVDQLKARLNGSTDVIEVDYHINDPEFTTLAAETLHSLMVSRLSDTHVPH
jgi:uncharacterized protein (UPF0261 family)